MLSLERARQFLRVTHANDDSLIEDFIDAAIAKGEQVTGRSLVEKQAIIEEVNDYGTILLPSPPISTVDKVEYLLNNEYEELTLNSGYVVYGLDEKTIGISTSYERIRVTFTTSYEDNADINRLLYELIGVWYDNRPDVDMLEAKVIMKLAKYKLWEAA